MATMTKKAQAELIKSRLEKYPAVAKRLLKAADFIEKHPEHLTMHTWCDVKGEGEWGSPTCGTTACLVGWYAFLKPGWVYASGGGWGVATIRNTRTGERVEIGQTLMDDLKLNEVVVHDDAYGVEYLDLESLVVDGHWPARFRNPYQRYAPEHSHLPNNTPNAAKAAKVAANRLRYFVETGR